MALSAIFAGATRYTLRALATLRRRHTMMDDVTAFIAAADAFIFQRFSVSIMLHARHCCRRHASACYAAWRCWRYRAAMLRAASYYGAHTY